MDAGGHGSFSDNLEEQSVMIERSGLLRRTFSGSQAAPILVSAAMYQMILLESQGMST